MNLSQMYESHEPLILQAQKLVDEEWAQRIRDKYDETAKSLPLIAKAKELIETKLGRYIEAEDFMTIISMLLSTMNAEFMAQMVLDVKSKHQNYSLSERVLFQTVKTLCGEK